MSARRFLVLHGPNLLKRDTAATTSTPTIHEINQYLKQLATDLGVEIEILQSDHVDVLVDKLSEQMDTVRGCIINPDGLFPGVPIHDAFKRAPFPVIEVHPANVHAPSDATFITPAATGQITGLGWRGYVYALLALVDLTGEDSYAKES